MANLLWTVCITQLAYMAPSSRLEDGGGHPRATVSTHWLNYMRVANGLKCFGDMETDGNGNPSGEIGWPKTLCSTTMMRHICQGCLRPPG